MTDTYTLVFETDNVCNTRIFDSDTDALVYDVTTEIGKETVTKVKRDDGETIASWEWHDFRSDVITLGQSPPVSVDAWLRKSLLPFQHTVKFTDPHGRKLKWKGNASGLSLQLFSEDDKSEPLARFVKSRRVIDRKATPPTTTWHNARLIMDPRCAAVQDLAIVSFLVLERKHRETEISTTNRADAIASAHFNGS